MRRTLVVLSTATVLWCLPPAALAQWSDNFDSYAAGQQLYHVGGWTGWDDVQNASGTATDVLSRSRPNSITVSGTSDAVHPFSGYTSGMWTFTAYQYIPANLDALTYFILNNEYTHGGPYRWAIETHMNPATGKVNDAQRDPQGNNATNIIYDQWVEIRVDFDLDNNTMTEFYGGTQISSGVWNTGGGAVALANVDLYAPHDVPVYYDDISLVPEPASALLLALGALLIRRR